MSKQIAIELEALGALRDKPQATIRATCTDDQIELRPLCLSGPRFNDDMRHGNFVL